MSNAVYPVCCDRAVNGGDRQLSAESRKDGMTENQERML